MNLSRASLLVGLLGCGGGDHEGVDVLDGGKAACAPAPDAGTALVVPAASGALQLSFGVTVDAQTFGADAGISRVSLTNGVGTVQIDGETLPSMVYQRPPRATPGQDLVQGLAVSPTRLVVFWITCANGQPDAIEYIATDGTPYTQMPGVMGTCSIASSSTDVSVAWPSSTLEPPLVQGFTMSGPNVSYDGTAPGQVTLSGQPWQVYPFDKIDCSTCASPGWYELHAVLWQSSCSRACYGIFYLYQDHPSDVRLDWVFCLPDFGDPTGGGANLTASWSD